MQFTTLPLIVLGMATAIAALPAEQQTANTAAAPQVAATMAVRDVEFTKKSHHTKTHRTKTHKQAHTKAPRAMTTTLATSVTITSTATKPAYTGPKSDSPIILAHFSGKRPPPGFYISGDDHSDDIEDTTPKKPEEHDPAENVVYDMSTGTYRMGLHADGTVIPPDWYDREDDHPDSEEKA